MKELTIFNPAVFSVPGKVSFEEGLKRDPNCIALQAGSSDSGPLYVGAGLSHYPRSVHKQIFEMTLPAALSRGIPLIVSGAGGNGTRKQVEYTLDIIRDVATRNGLKFRMAVIDAELDKAYLKKKLAKGEITRLGFPRDMTSDDIERSEVITAMMGVEPIIKALKEDVDVVIAGRAVDDSTYAALPIKEGFDRGLSLHMGKVIECAALVAEPQALNEGVIGRIRKDHFLVEPTHPKFKCTVKSVVSHSLYEREHPYLMPGPGGVNDLTKCKFEQADGRTVRVSGSKFIEDEVYRVKLEGAALVGYRAVNIVGVRDPIFIDKVDEVLEGVRKNVKERYPNTNYQLIFHLYGKNAVMDPLFPRIREEATPKELGLVWQVIADDLQTATEICELVNIKMMWQPYEGQKCTSGNIACLGSMEVFIPLHKKVYEWSVDHLLAVEDPCECFKMWIEEVKG